MTIKIYNDIVQGTDEWLELRRGILTASEVKHVLTPTTLKYSKSEKCRAHAYELAAQRISMYVEPSYIGDDMLRGWEDEVRACALYAEKYAPVDQCGFITNNKWGFTIGYSPDGMVGSDGLLECKSRKQKFQIETISKDEVPQEYWLQLQTGLLVSERAWIDFISYSGGLPMYVKRVEPHEETMQAIKEAAMYFEEQINNIIESYAKNSEGLYMTERTETETEITL